MLPGEPRARRGQVYVDARLVEYQQREGLPSVVAAVERLLS